MKLLDVVARVRELTKDRPYAVIGGLAQILWARKSHTDDVDIALASEDLHSAISRVQTNMAGASWSLPTPPDRVHERDEVFEVAHLLCDGSVVDLLSFANAGFNAEIIDTARPIPALGGVRFVRPELLLVTHLLRPGPTAALAAIELVIARRAFEPIDVEYTTRWAEGVGKGDRLARVLEQARAMDAI
jgi:hypothetical protein